MRVVVQRVSEASVTVDGEERCAIKSGLLVYLGVDRTDAGLDATALADKVRHLRIFPDDKGRMNRDVAEAGGAVLVVSAFSVQADARRGRRPSFDDAAAPEQAEPLYRLFCDALAEHGVHVERGLFGAYMMVHSVNDGPICILTDSRRLF